MRCQLGVLPGGVRTADGAASEACSGVRGAHARASGQIDAASRGGGGGGGGGRGRTKRQSGLERRGAGRGMDHLLHKLRQNMAELSVQGDDFTRQIWQMYATFEELVESRDGRAPRASKSRARPRHAHAHAHAHHRRAVIGGSALELGAMSGPAAPAASTSASTSASATAAIEFSVDADAAMVPQGAKDDLSIVYHPCKRYRRPPARRHNPLLDTISCIQDACDSDQELGPPSGRSTAHRLDNADKDSIGYAGSNSIDSGYKSSCPTPEPGDAGLLLYAGDSKRSSIAASAQKPRIAMGTKVINRHSHPQYAGRDLDHLMYLRQSILSAMQRYERQGSGGGGGGGGAGGAGSSSAADVSRSPRRGALSSCPQSRTHSPSPSASPAACRLATAEEDIDTLLYGQPCSYVTMIEDKYRRSSVARVKKLREKSRSGGPAGAASSSSSDSSCAASPSASASASPTRLPALNAVNMPLPLPLSLAPPVLPVAQPSCSSSAAAAAASGAGARSGRFSEVAKCMLEIIEDLQNQTQSPPEPAPLPPSQQPATEYHVYEEIMYEMTTRPRDDPKRVPPPLPARPRSFKPAASRPKQRSNLYSLFREQSARRNISQSLEKEFRRARRQYSSSSSDEEYGFRVHTQ
ncbi:uncharacterized protein LOC126298302 [Schistocerca gregaria]|uniref:uncharacterized protein LOC126298302 n=1 Tax=Schistocerca gregaria TaxID=7010 RepID=UPI00211DD11F|nr:uncharacterized protein LOC126298302 [Schistocerca gregaria]